MSSFVQTPQRKAPEAAQPTEAPRTVIVVGAQAETQTQGSGCSWIAGLFVVLLPLMILAGVGLIPLPWDIPGVTPVNYFDEPERIHQALVEELGEGYRVETLALYPEYAVITVAPTPGEAILDRYTLRRGTLGDKDPQRVSGRDKSTLEATLIAPEAIEFNKTVHMRADAVAALDIAGAAVSHLVLNFSTTEPKGPRWGVYVTSERESGFCEYSLQGARLQCHQ